MNKEINTYIISRRIIEKLHASTDIIIGSKAIAYDTMPTFNITSREK